MGIIPQKVAVVGGGISGLSTAYKLMKQGHDVVVFESHEKIGGKISTEYKDGFELDLGPVTIAETPEIIELSKELGLEIIPASTASSIRYIYSKGKLHRVTSVMTSSLLSLGGKLSMLKAPFTSKGQEDESVASYARRRFGEEAYRRLIDPMMSGIYAGNPELLSAKSVFKKRGKRNVISLKGGIAALTNALASKLKIATGRTIDDLSELKDFEKIILTTPAFVTAQLIRELEPALSKIQYSSLTQTFCEVIPGERKFDGFGFLVPSEEKMSLLGAICVSNIFPSKAPEGKMLFVLFARGSNALAQFNNIVQPAVAKQLYIREWNNAIPQPHVGHQIILDQITRFEKEHPDISIKGNYVTGVAVGDCL
jgi:oxygen-dependent protoporphyrinogen oxidase